MNHNIFDTVDTFQYLEGVSVAHYWGTPGPHVSTEGWKNKSTANPGRSWKLIIRKQSFYCQFILYWIFVNHLSVWNIWV